MAATLIVLLPFTLFAASFARIPEAKCSINDDNLDSCLKDAFNDVIPQLSSEGIPEVNLTPLDPLMIKELVISPNEERFSGFLQVSDIVVKGLNNTTITDLSSDFSKPLDQTLEMVVTIPKLIVSGKYSGAVKVDGAKLFGDGEFRIKITDIKASVDIVADRLKGKGGNEYFIVKTLDVNPTIGTLKVNATRLFNENAVMANFFLNMVNNYWPYYFDLVMTQIKPLLNEFIKTQINAFTSKIPADRIVKP